MQMADGSQQGQTCCKHPKQLQEKNAANLLHKAEVGQATRGAWTLC